jgi:hypothetical protein
MTDTLCLLLALLLWGAFVAWLSYDAGYARGAHDEREIFRVTYAHRRRRRRDLEPEEDAADWWK